MLKIENLIANVENKTVLKNINLDFEDGKTYVVLGKNGSGKTSLLMTLMGISKYKVTDGRIILNNEDITNFDVYKRSKAGISLSYQKPPAIEGIRLFDLIKVNEMELHKYMNILKIDPDFLTREVNKGLSGGEVKRTELLQVISMKPKIALLDEPDSGVDIDSIKYILAGINELRKISSTLIIVTHNIEMAKKIAPDEIIVINDGRVTNRGNTKILEEINENGFGD